MGFPGPIGPGLIEATYTAAAIMGLCGFPGPIGPGLIEARRLVVTGHHELAFSGAYRPRPH